MSRVKKPAGTAADPRLVLDAEGRMIFSPWGNLGKGYVLPDDARRQQVLRFSAGCCLTPLLYNAVTGFTRYSSSAFPVMLLAVAAYAVGCRFLVRGLEVARERSSFRDVCAATVPSVGFPMLALGFGVSFIAAWGATRLFSRGPLLTGILGIVVSGILANFFGFLILLKIRRAGAGGSRDAGSDS